MTFQLLSSLRKQIVERVQMSNELTNFFAHHVVDAARERQSVTHLHNLVCNIVVDDHAARQAGWRDVPFVAQRAGAALAGLAEDERRMSAGARRAIGAFVDRLDHECQ